MHGQHTKVRRSLFGVHGVVFFMGSDKAIGVKGRRFKPAQTAVNDNLVDTEIDGTIGHDAISKGAQFRVLIKTAKKNREKTGDRKEESKGVIVMKKLLVVGIMMVFVQDPQKSVHDIFVEEPSHKFHPNKSDYKDGDKDVHEDSLFKRINLAKLF